MKYVEFLSTDSKYVSLYVQVHIVATRHNITFSFRLGCGGTMTAVSGEIISPGYPQPYHHRADCYWTIRVNEGSIVNFHITDIDMETGSQCAFDFIEVSRMLTQYCPQYILS